MDFCAIRFRLDRVADFPVLFRFFLLAVEHDFRLRIGKPEALYVIGIELQQFFTPKSHEGLIDEILRGEVREEHLLIRTSQHIERRRKRTGISDGEAFRLRPGVSGNDLGIEMEIHANEPRKKVEEARKLPVRRIPEL